MKKLWYQPFLAILASTFQMFGSFVFVLTEVFLGFRHLPKLVRIQNYHSCCSLFIFGTISTIFISAFMATIFYRLE